MHSDVVDWSAVPSRAGEKGATWGRDSDADEPTALFPRNAYGNYMVFRDQWLSINGTNEAVTNTCHYEDIDFCVRARNAKLVCSRKAQKLYQYIDTSDYYSNPVDPDCRSWMNIPFTLADADKDAAFLEGAGGNGLLTLKGHRSVGGMRASIYNAMPEAGVDALIAYMDDFEKQHG